MKRIPIVAIPLFLSGVLPGQSSSQAKAAQAILSLEKASQAPASFRQLQSILLLFEKGLDRNGWDQLGRFYRDHPQVKNRKLLDRVEALAIHSLMDPSNKNVDPVKRARALLIGLRPSLKNTRREAINHLVPRALGKLLQMEAKTAKQRKERKERKRAKTSMFKKTLRPILAVLAKNAGNGLSRQKDAAQRALLLGDEEARRACYRLALKYPQGPTRRRILNLVRKKGLGAEAVPVIGQGFHSQYPLLHIRAARALRELGAKEALPLLKKESFHLAKLLAKLRRAGNGGAGPRANLSVIKQQAIIRDYNVEVAQNAAIADPIVDVISEGVVLDVKVLGVSVFRHILLAKREVDKAYHALKPPSSVKRSHN